MMSVDAICLNTSLSINKVLIMVCSGMEYDAAN